MARLAIPSKEAAPAKAQPILANYEKVLGVIPNFFALISQSPDALKAIADMHGALGKSLGHKTRERIHVMTAEVNGCNYCLSAHTYLGAKLQGLTPEDMELNRVGHSTDPKADAALQFAYKIATSRGHIEDADVEAVRAAGYTDEQIVDIVAETAFSFITNLFNNTFKTDIDATFPPLQTRAREAA
ncbi:carboxymuconolactone decarboxylase family protein [Burkholderia sp. 22088]|uniref:carboxymuconolactone decarboxylase family protein n=1 Tax=Burkholderia sp. 22088 TaxID=3453871 RepID=UPI003F829F0F